MTSELHATSTLTQGEDLFCRLIRQLGETLSRPGRFTQQNLPSVTESSKDFSAVQPITYCELGTSLKY